MPETEFRKEHYYVLLAQLLRSQAIFHIAQERIEGVHFTKVGGTVAQAIIFDTIKNYDAAHGVVPDAAVLITEIQIFVDKHFKVPENAKGIIEEANHFLTIAEKVTEKSEPMARAIIKFIADGCVHRPAVEDAFREFKESESHEATTALRESIERVESAQSLISGGLSCNNIVDMEETETGEIMPTYVPWIDARFSNGQGLPRGSTMAIIAPQGHGKTTFGIQLAVAQAVHQQHAMLALAEEGMTLPMRAKIMACALGIPYEKIRDAEPKLFRDKLAFAVKACNLRAAVAVKKIDNVCKYLHVLDLFNNGAVADTLSAVEGEIQLLNSKGQCPTYVYVDWAGTIADAMMAAEGHDRKEPTLKRISHGLARIAQQHNVIGAISQQMAPAEMQRGPFWDYGFACGADCKGFTEPCKTVFVIAPRDPRTKYSILHTPKVRDGEQPDKSVMHLKGEISTFLDVSEQWEIRGKRLMYRGPDGGGDDAASGNRVPTL